MFTTCKIRQFYKLRCSTCTYLDRCLIYQNNHNGLKPYEVEIQRNNNTSTEKKKMEEIKMGIGNYSQSRTIDWGIDTKSMEFIKCKDLIEKGKEESEVIELLGFFITPDSGYGRGAVLITEQNLINIPSRYVEDLDKMYDDTSVINQIKSGHAAFKVKTFYSTKFKKTGYSIEFIDR